MPWIVEQLAVPGQCRIFQAFRGFLGEDRLRQVEMDVTVFEHRGDFRQHARRSGAGGAADALGYYQLPQNAVYTFQQRDFQAWLGSGVRLRPHRH